jgi:hypothetical protein
MLVASVSSNLEVVGILITVQVVAAAKVCFPPLLFVVCSLSLRSALALTLSAALTVLHLSAHANGGHSAKYWEVRTEWGT